ncbi:MAG TPA: hypothetical protein PKI19_09520 [Elusimicrobiales bacterium]|nr:hypothetical protein [Elusimicrobiales bacterium]
MATLFSETLTRLRREAGFPTAYRFFHDNCGDKVLGMCYRKYLLMEQGRILPLFKHLRGFLFSLRLVRGSAPGAELVRAWLRTMAGEELYKEILEPLVPERREVLALSPSQKALKEAIAGKKFYMTVEQMALTVESAQSNLCYELLSNDSGVWTAARLAAEAGLKPAAAQKMLKKFAAVKLLRKAGAGYKCPLAESLVEYPNRAAAPELFARAMERHNELVKTGKGAWFRRGIIRADADAMKDFYQLMAMNISSVTAFSIKQKTPKSALFAVEAKAVKIRDF